MRASKSPRIAHLSREVAVVLAVELTRDHVRACRRAWLVPAVFAVAVVVVHAVSRQHDRLPTHHTLERVKRRLLRRRDASNGTRDGPISAQSAQSERCEQQSGRSAEAPPFPARGRRGGDGERRHSCPILASLPSRTCTCDVGFDNRKGFQTIGLDKNKSYKLI